MAGDWIPMRTDLLTDPSVVAISLELGVPPTQVAGCLLAFWGWATTHLTDGHACVRILSRKCHADVRGVSEVIDALCGLEGFTTALEAVGWLRFDPQKPGWFTIPGWDRYLSQGGKSRLLANRRKQLQRANEKEQKRVRILSRSQRDENETTEQNRTEEMMKTPPNNIPPDRRAGCAGVVVEEESPPAGEPPTAVLVADRMAREFGLGYPKATAAVEEHGTTDADLDAWHGFLAQRGRRLTLHWLTRVRHPSQIDGGEDFATKRKTEKVRKVLEILREDDQRRKDHGVE